MIVVDTNVSVQLFVAGSDTSLARQLFELDAIWFVPPVWPHEFLNVMATYAKAGAVPLTTCLARWQRAFACFQPYILQTDYPSALRLAVRHALSAYDAQFVQLARELEIPLITEDRRLRNKFPELAFGLQDYLEKRSAS